jgi:hypothetical protein
MAGEEGARIEVTFEVTVTLGVDAPIPDEHDMERVGVADLGHHLVQHVSVERWLG